MDGFPHLVNMWLRTKVPVVRMASCSTAALSALDRTLVAAAEAEASATAATARFSCCIAAGFSAEIKGKTGKKNRRKFALFHHKNVAPRNALSLSHSHFKGKWPLTAIEH